MTDREFRELLRYVEGDLSEEEATALESRLAGEAELRGTLHSLTGSRKQLLGDGQMKFEEGFAQRVMARVQAEGAPAGGLFNPTWLNHYFRRVVPVALGLCLVLGGYTLAGGDGTGTRTALEELFGLPEVSLDVAYAIDVTTLIGN